MLIAIIPITSIESARTLMQQAARADLFEFRLDYLTSIDLNAVQSLQQAAQKPVLFTLRKKEQGGVYNHDEQTRLDLIEQLMSLHPDYLDIEHDVPIEFSQKLKNISPKTQLICSYHNFVDTPNDLADLLRKIKNPIFSYYKIITQAQSILDTLKVLDFIKTHAQDTPLIAHAMGEVGIPSRILGKIFGNRFTYAAMENNIAPGLLSLGELIDIYHDPQLNSETQIYGLIGDPVAQSIGHVFHNAEFIKNKQNAVYVKFQVKPAELADFFQLIQRLSIQGLSVTMPHKQAVLAFCQQLTREVQDIHAANTLIKNPDGYLAANTDGDAVVEVLNQDLHNKKIILLGAGGAASSIIYSLIKAGAKVCVYNRTEDKLIALRQKFQIETFSLDKIATADYDILINTIPAKSYQNVIPFIKNKIILDANYQATPTALIQDAIKHGCITIDGFAMFYAQARMQQQLWLKR